MVSGLVRLKRKKIKKFFQELSKTKLEEAEIETLIKNAFSNKSSESDPGPLWTEVSYTLTKNFLISKDYQTEITFSNISKYIKSNLKSLLHESIAKCPKYKAILWVKLNQLWNEIQSSVEEESFDFDISKFISWLLTSLIDLSVVTRYPDSCKCFNIQERLRFIDVYCKESSVDIILHCKTWVLPNHRKPEVFIPIVRYIVKEHSKSKSNIPKFLKLVLLAKLLFIMSKNGNKESKVLFLEIQSKLAIPSNFSVWAEQNMSWTLPHNAAFKTIVKHADSPSIFQILYPKNSTSMPVKRSIAKTSKKLPVQERNLFFENVPQKIEKAAKNEKRKRSALSKVVEPRNLFKEASIASHKKSKEGTSGFSSSDSFPEKEVRREKECVKRKKPMMEECLPQKKSRISCSPMVIKGWEVSPLPLKVKSRSLNDSFSATCASWSVERMRTKRKRGFDKTDPLRYKLSDEESDPNSKKQSQSLFLAEHCDKKVGNTRKKKTKNLKTEDAKEFFLSKDKKKNIQTRSMKPVISSNQKECVKRKKPMMEECLPQKKSRISCSPMVIKGWEVSPLPLKVKSGSLNDSFSATCASWSVERMRTKRKREFDKTDPLRYKLSDEESDPNSKKQSQSLFLAEHCDKKVGNTRKKKTKNLKTEDAKEIFLSKDKKKNIQTRSMKPVISSKLVSSSSADTVSKGKRMSTENKNGSLIDYISKMKEKQLKTENQSSSSTDTVSKKKGKWLKRENQKDSSDTVPKRKRKQLKIENRPEIKFEHVNYNRKNQGETAVDNLSKSCTLRVTAQIESDGEVEKCNELGKLKLTKKKKGKKKTTKENQNSSSDTVPKTKGKQLKIENQPEIKSGHVTRNRKNQGETTVDNLSKSCTLRVTAQIESDGEVEKCNELGKLKLMKKKKGKKKRTKENQNSSSDTVPKTKVKQLKIENQPEIKSGHVTRNRKNQGETTVDNLSKSCTLEVAVHIESDGKVEKYNELGKLKLMKKKKGKKKRNKENEERTAVVALPQKVSKSMEKVYKNANNESTDEETLNEGKTKRKIRRRRKLIKDSKEKVEKELRKTTVTITPIPSSESKPKEPRLSKDDSDSDLEVLVETIEGDEISRKEECSEKSEVDEASGSDGDIVPCDENTKMFTNEETSVYHQYLMKEVEERKKEKLKEKVREILSQEQDSPPKEPQLKETEKEDVDSIPEEERTKEKNEKEGNCDFISSLYKPSPLRSKGGESLSESRDKNESTAGKEDEECCYGDDDDDDLEIIFDTIKRDTNRNESIPNRKNQKSVCNIKEEIPSDEDIVEVQQTSKSNFNETSKKSEDFVSKIFNIYNPRVEEDETVDSCIAVVYDKSKESNSEKDKILKFRKRKELDSKGSNESASKGSNESASKGSNESASKGSNESASKGSNESASKGSNESASKGSNESASKGSNESASKGSSESASKGSNESASKGSNESASKGSNESASKGSNESASKGSNESASKGSNDLASRESEAVVDLASRESEAVVDLASRESEAVVDLASRESEAVVDLASRESEAVVDLASRESEAVVDLASRESEAVVDLASRESEAVVDLASRESEAVVDLAAEECEAVVDLAAEECEAVVDLAAEESEAVVDLAAEEFEAVVDLAARESEAVVDLAARESEAVVDLAARESEAVVDLAARESEAVVDLAARESEAVVDLAARESEAVVDLAARESEAVVDLAARESEAVVDLAARESEAVVDLAARESEAVVDLAARESEAVVDLAARESEAVVDLAARESEAVVDLAARESEAVVDLAARESEAVVDLAARESEAVVDLAARESEAVVDLAARESEAVVDLAARESEAVVDLAARESEAVVDLAARESEAVVDLAARESEAVVDLAARESEAVVDLAARESEAVVDLAARESEAVVDLAARESEAVVDLAARESEAVVDLAARESEAVVDLAARESEAVVDLAARESEAVVDLAARESEAVVDLAARESEAAVDLAARESEAAVDLAARESEAAVDLAARESEAAVDLAARVTKAEEINLEESGDSDSKGNENSDSKGNENSDSKGNENSDSKGNENSDSKGNENSDSKGNENSDSKGNENSDSKGNENSDSRGNENSDSRGNENSDSRGNENSDSRGNENSDSRGNENSDSRGNENSDSRGNENSDSRGNENSDSRGNENPDSKGHKVSLLEEYENSLSDSESEDIVITCCGSSNKEKRKLCNGLQKSSEKSSFEITEDNQRSIRATAASLFVSDESVSGENGASYERLNGKERSSQNAYKNDEPFLSKSGKSRVGNNVINERSSEILVCPDLTSQVVVSPDSKNLLLKMDDDDSDESSNESFSNCVYECFSKRGKGNTVDVDKSVNEISHNKLSYKKVLNFDDGETSRGSGSLSAIEFSELQSKTRNSLSVDENSLKELNELECNNNFETNNLDAIPKVGKSNSDFVGNLSNHSNSVMGERKSGSLISESGNTNSENKENVENNKQEGEEIEVLSGLVHQTCFEEVPSLEEQTEQFLILKSPLTQALVPLTYISPKKSGVTRKREGSSSNIKGITTLTPLKVASAALANEIVISPDVSDEENASPGPNTQLENEDVIKFLPDERILSKSNVEEEQVIDICDKNSDENLSSKSPTRLVSLRKSSRKSTERCGGKKNVKGQDASSPFSKLSKSSSISESQNDASAAKKNSKKTKSKSKSPSPVSSSDNESRNASPSSTQSDIIIPRRSPRLSERNSESSNIKSETSTDVKSSESEVEYNATISQTDSEVNDSEERDIVISPVKMHSNRYMLRRFGLRTSPGTTSLSSPKCRRNSASSLKNDGETMEQKTLESPSRPRSRRNSCHENLTPVRRSRRISGLAEETLKEGK